MKGQYGTPMGIERRGGRWVRNEKHHTRGGAVTVRDLESGELLRTEPPQKPPPKWRRRKKR